MNRLRNICAVVPVKETWQAKQRLAGVLSAAQRRELALAMIEHVLDVLASVPELAGILVVTTDPAAAALAARRGARVSVEGASEGHTGAVAAAARRLVAEGCDLLTVPGDIPLVEAGDIHALLASHCEDRRRNGRAFSIVPARDRRGSNAIVCSPAGAVPLRFGVDSFVPHLAAARACGIEPRAVQLPRIALDIDTPDDLAQLMAAPPHGRAHALLRRWGGLAWRASA